MLTPTRLKPYVLGRDRPLSRSCSNFLAWQTIMRNIFVIMLTLLHRWRTLQVPSDLGRGVLRRTAPLSSFVNYYVTLRFYACLTLISRLWLTRMHVVMRPGLYCYSSMTMVCIHLLTIVASTVRRERNYGGGEKELLAIYQACVKWRCYIDGVPTTIYTDHEPWVNIWT